MNKNPSHKFNKGHKPWNFKEDNVGYHSLHQWVANHKPKSLFCECCGKLTDKLDASSNGHTYERDISKWRWLCRKCHFKEDKAIKKHKLVCKNGHKLEGTNLITNNRSNRVCKECKKLLAKKDYLKHKDRIINQVNIWRKKKRSSKRFL